MMDEKLILIYKKSQIVDSIIGFLLIPFSFIVLGYIVYSTTTESNVVTLNYVIGIGTISVMTLYIFFKRYIFINQSIGMRMFKIEYFDNHKGLLKKLYYNIVHVIIIGSYNKFLGMNFIETYNKSVAYSGITIRFRKKVKR